MSSFGSSLINKSGRRVAPKAVARRKLPVASARSTTLESPGISPDVVASIEPIATGDEVLQAQTQLQDDIIATDAANATRSEHSAALNQAVEDAPQPVVSNNARNDVSIASDTIDSPNHRQKRVRLEKEPEAVNTLRARAVRTAPGNTDSRVISSPATRSRTAAQKTVPTPSSHQDARNNPRRNRNSNVEANGTVNNEGTAVELEIAEHEAERQLTNDANWVVTTQDQVRKKTNATRRRQTSRHRSSDSALPPRDSESVIPPAGESTTSNSARLANRERRKMKKQALRGIMDEASSQMSNKTSASHNNAADGDRPTVGELGEAGDQQNDVSSVAGTNGREKTRRSRKRADTPDEMENVTIVDSLVTMAELSTRERKYGKKSDRERKMRLIDWDIVKSRRREEEIRMALERGRYKNNAPPNPEDDEDEGDLENEENLDAALSRVAARNRARRRGTGIRIRVVNGEHVIDEQSQRVDRHALANEDLDALEEVEEEELTQRFNSQTYVNMKRRDPAERLPNNDRWTSESTDKFYECLARFGTDFMIISKMFPGRTRRQIKAKFIREERIESARVHDALYGGLNVGGDEEDDQRLRWDLEVFRENAGIELSQLLDPRQVERDLESVRKEREVAIAEQRKETEEMKRQRRLAGEVSSEDEEEQQQKSANETKTGAAKARVPDDELEEVEEF